MRVSRNLKESELKFFFKISGKYLKLLSLCCKSNPYLLSSISAFLFSITSCGFLPSRSSTCKQNKKIKN